MMTQREIQKVQDTLEDWFGIKVPDTFLNEHVPPGLVNEMREMGLDTVVREQLICAVSKALVGRDWPIGADGEDYAAKFFANFRVAAPAHKIVIKPKWMDEE